MDLKEILQREEKNTGCIFLYQEEGAWYAYERSAFYCYSLLGIVDMDWIIPFADQEECKIVRVRVSEPDRFLHTPLLRVLQKKKTEYTILCKISCGGFYYWRVRLEAKFHALQKE
ncbi:hypothetical protein [Bacteroides thetaiotaomicron]|uniref:hypothetical protein n=1 Tax=Bacteroides thetaiotaomicron TaxID=818 RepID=UPI003DA649B4